MKHLLVAAILALSLPGCAIFDRDDRAPPGVEQVKPRDVTPRRIVEAYTAVSATAELVALAAKVGTITPAKGRQLSQLLKVALTAVDKSTDLWIEGDKAKSAAALTAALAAIEEARIQAKTSTDKGVK